MTDIGMQYQELKKLLIHRQIVKEFKQLDGPLKNWAIFYGRWGEQSSRLHDNFPSKILCDVVS